ncbi:Glucoamylase [Wickerhamomyces ciferrii]|uniref:glucan 1,4-alpha-glucosidase n=1 Tax=Wickerhamomyces ciferrii (strain ATCC 14091 / BCRC 22168 / CBS 111 / JCM 3599 / NBRC 0793 / NRRL Y-1031 F-60-10) TaxID=1206466 RepID=K0KMK3_WICCF|nr:Glucoamylase [Wickerhamomyces ciferrii]CCH46510.1 Glucoamylase [Wickerhamomyces ciferrii]
MIFSRLYQALGVASSALAIQIASQPAELSDSTRVQLASYNLTEGILSADFFVYDDENDKSVFLYYSNAKGESSPLLTLSADQVEDLPNNWTLFTASNYIFPQSGIDTLLNVTLEVRDGPVYTQELNIKVEGDGKELPEQVHPEPSIHPSGYSDDIDEWLNVNSKDSQIYKAKQRVFANIGPEGAVPGLVIASPSHGEDTENPDYFYHWIRDAGLTYDSLYKLYKALPNRDSQAARGIEDYFIQFIAATIDEQKDKTAISGLAEPKWYAKNNTGYQLGWGRPQNDGPAVRAYALIEFVKEYINKGGDRNYIIDLAWEEPIKVDLDYLQKNWTEKDFDAWEETRSHHFFNSVVQKKAFVLGAEFASEYLRDVSSYRSYSESAEAVNATLANYLSPERNIILNTYGPALHAKISYKDLSTILGITNGYLGDGIFAATNDWSLRTVYEHATTFLDVFPVSNTTTDEEGRPLAPPTGRYPEDVYNGTGTQEGNPWFLSSNTIAEYFFLIVKDFQDAGVIQVSELSLPFWKYYTGVSEVGTISKDSEQFDQVIQSLIGWGDAYIRTVKYYAGEDGHLSEQYDKNNGVIRGARDLTWSYASLFIAAITRAIARGDDTYATSLAFLDGDIH